VVDFSYNVQEVWVINELAGIHETARRFALS